MNIEGGESSKGRKKPKRRRKIRKETSKIG